MKIFPRRIIVVPDNDTYELHITNSSTTDLILLFRIKRSERKVLTFGPKKGFVLPGETRSVAISILSREFVRTKLLVKVVAVRRTDVDSIDFEKSWQAGLKYKGEIKKIVDLIDSEADLDTIINSKSQDTYDEFSDLISEVSSFSYPNPLQIPRKPNLRIKSQDRSESAVSAFELSSEFANTPGASPDKGSLIDFDDNNRMVSISNKNEEIVNREEPEGEEEEIADQTIELLKLVSKQLTLTPEQFQDTLNKRLPQKEISKLANFFSSLINSTDSKNNSPIRAPKLKDDRKSQLPPPSPTSKNRRKDSFNTQNSATINLPSSTAGGGDVESLKDADTVDSRNTGSISEIAKNNDTFTSNHLYFDEKKDYHQNISNNKFNKQRIAETDSILSQEEAAAAVRMNQQFHKLNSSVQSLYSLPPNTQEIVTSNNVERIIHEHEQIQQQQNLLNRSLDSRISKQPSIKQSNASPSRPSRNQQRQQEEDNENEIHQSANYEAKGINDSLNSSRNHSLQEGTNRFSSDFTREKKPTAISGMPMIDTKTLEAFSSLISNSEPVPPLLASTILASSANLSSSLKDPLNHNFFTLEIFNNHVNESLLKEIIETRIIYSIESRQKINSIILQNLPILSLKDSLSLAFSEPMDIQTRQPIELNEQEKQLLALRNIYLEDFLHSLTIEFSSLISFDNSINRFHSLTSLDLSNNHIKYIDGMILLPNLTYLNLSNNFLKSLDYLQCLTNLKTLIVHKNKIENFQSSVNVIITLSNCLMNIDLSENPVANDLRYAEEIILAFPKLKIFDNISIEKLYKSYTTNDAINKYRLQLQQQTIYGNRNTTKKVIQNMLPEFPCVLFDEERKLLSTSLSKDTNQKQVTESEVKFEFIQKLKRALGLKAFHLRKEHVLKMSSSQYSQSSRTNTPRKRSTPTSHDASHHRRSNSSHNYGQQQPGEMTDFLQMHSDSRSIYLDMDGQVVPPPVDNNGLHSHYDFDPNSPDEILEKSLKQSQRTPNYARKREHYEQVIARSQSDEPKEFEKVFSLSKSASSERDHRGEPLERRDLSREERRAQQQNSQSQIYYEQQQQLYQQQQQQQQSTQQGSYEEKQQEQIPPQQNRHYEQQQQQPQPYYQQHYQQHQQQQQQHQPQGATQRSHSAPTSPSKNYSQTPSRSNSNNQNNTTFRGYEDQYLDPIFHDPTAQPHFASHTTSSKKVGRAHESTLVPHWGKRSYDDQDLDLFQTKWKPKPFKGAAPGYDWYLQPHPANTSNSSLNKLQQRSRSISPIRPRLQHDEISVTPSLLQQTESGRSRIKATGVNDASVVGDPNMTYHSDTEISTRGRVQQQLSRSHFKEMQENERYGIYHPRYRIPKPVFGFSKPFAYRPEPDQKEHAPLFDKTVKRLRDGFERLPTRGTFTRAAKGLTAEWYPMDFSDLEAIRRQGYFHETIGQIPKFSYQDFRTEESLKQTMNMNHSVSSIGEAKINSSGSVLISPQKTGRRGVQGAHVSRMYKSSEGRIENTPEDNFSGYRKWHPDLIPTNNTNGMNNSILLSPSYDMNNSTIASLTSQMIKKQQHQNQNQSQSNLSFQQENANTPPKKVLSSSQGAPSTAQKSSRSNQDQYPPHQHMQQQHHQQYGVMSGVIGVAVPNSNLNPNGLSSGSNELSPNEGVNSRRPSITSAITLDTMIDSQHIDPNIPPQTSPMNAHNKSIPRRISPGPPSAMKRINTPNSNSSVSTPQGSISSKERVFFPPDPVQPLPQQQSHSQSQSPSVQMRQSQQQQPPQSQPAPQRKKSVLGEIFGTTEGDDASPSQPSSSNHIQQTRTSHKTQPPNNNTSSSSSNNNQSSNIANSTSNNWKKSPRKTLEPLAIPTSNQSPLTPPSTQSNKRTPGTSGSGKKVDYNAFFQDDQELIKQTKYFIEQSNLDNQPIPPHLLSTPSLNQDPQAPSPVPASATAAGSNAIPLNNASNNADMISYVSSNASLTSQGDLNSPFALANNNLKQKAVAMLSNIHDDLMIDSPASGDAIAAPNTNTSKVSQLSTPFVRLQSQPPPQQQQQQQFPQQAELASNSREFQTPLASASSLSSISHYHVDNYSGDDHIDGNLLSPEQIIYRSNSSGGLGGNKSFGLATKSMETMPTIDEMGENSSNPLKRYGMQPMPENLYVSSSYHQPEPTKKALSIDDQASTTLSEIARNDISLSGQEDRMMSSYMRWLQEQEQLQLSRQQQQQQQQQKHVEETQGNQNNKGRSTKKSYSNQLAAPLSYSKSSEDIPIGPEYHQSKSKSEDSLNSNHPRYKKFPQQHHHPHHTHHSSAAPAVNNSDEPITTSSATSLDRVVPPHLQPPSPHEGDQHSSASSSYGITSNPTQVLQTPNKEMRISPQHPAALALKPEKEMSPFISGKNPLKTLFHSQPQYQQQHQSQPQEEGGAITCGSGGGGERKGKFSGKGYSLDDMMI